MPFFMVLRRVDAWIDHTAEVEAENAAVAVEIAVRNDGQVGWKPIGASEFWNARFVALDALSNEMADTVVTRG